MGEQELAAILQSHWAESVIWGSRSPAPALLNAPELAEAISGFGSIHQKILLSEYRVMWGYNWPGLCSWGLVVQGYLHPTDRWHGADNSRHFSGGMHMLIYHRFINLHRPSAMSHLNLIVKCLNRRQSVCTASTNPKWKNKWREWCKLK